MTWMTQNNTGKQSKMQEQTNIKPLKYQHRIKLGQNGAVMLPAQEYCGQKRIYSKSSQGLNEL